MNTNKQVMRGVRVYDVEEMLGKGTVIASDAVEALVRWDSDTIDTWTRWNELELLP